MPKDRIQFRRVGEEWTAYYLNDELQGVGDSYHADEWLQAHVGVEIIDDTHQDCMIDGHRAYPHLNQVTEVADNRQTREREAAALRAQADELIRQADELTGGTR